MHGDTLIKHAAIVSEDGIYHGNVLIHAGKIVNILNSNVEVAAEQVIDVDGKYLLPGLVDCHFHFNEPGRTHWEGYLTGSRAAAAGGVTTALDMPLNCAPATTNCERLAEKRSLIETQSIIDIGNWGGMSEDNLANLEELDRDGAIGFKAFMADTGIDEFKCINDDYLYAGMKIASNLDSVVGVHAENESVTTYLANQFQEEGRTDRAAFLASRPPETELEAIQRACFWAKTADCRLHVVHTSIAEGIKSIRKAKQDGTKVTVETCPHYLFFDERDFIETGPLLKCTPPLRTREHVNHLWQCILDGKVDVISSDHSPCVYEEKERGINNIWLSWGGITGVQAMLGVIMTEGYHKRGLPLSDITRMMSANPARIFRLYPKKGTILPGADADLIVMDIEREWTMETSIILSRNKHSPYIGRSFKGMVEQTFVRGKRIYMEGEILAEPGYGQLVRRNGVRG